MTFTKIASVFAFIIGAMAIFAGGQVLFLGKEVDYYVITWLPYYNFVMGALTFFITAVLIWKNTRYALPASVLTFAAHATVMLTLLTAYQEVVARESLVAMTVRLLVWGLILILIVLQSKKQAGASI